MKNQSGTYDLHITVNPKTLDASLITTPWQIHDIQNVQGIPHYIISRKFTGDDPRAELKTMVKKLESMGAFTRRQKIELHFSAESDLEEVRDAVGVIEVHYKFKSRGIFEVNQEQIEELNKKKFAFSFNKGTGRPILSIRFKDRESYRDGKVSGESLPAYIEEEEREIVIMDTNNNMDAFWPLRSKDRRRFSFADVPEWLVRV